MNLEEHYAKMRNAALQQWLQGKAEPDYLLESPDDTRRGISLIIRPPAFITDRIKAIQENFHRIEPHQYYYPASELHITVLSIISCYSGFRLENITTDDYRQAMRMLVEQVRPFSLTFAGLTASAGGIMVQGFPHGRGLEELRYKMRQHFQQSGLQQSIDQRYSIQTAHSTIIRFKTNIHDPKALVKTVKRYQHQLIGTFEVNVLELVYNDWYHRTSNSRLLEQYLLADSLGNVA
jgi:2'-5' RNA ligase